MYEDANLWNGADAGERVKLCRLAREAFTGQVSIMIPTYLAVEGGTVGCLVPAMAALEEHLHERVGFGICCMSLPDEARTILAAQAVIGRCRLVVWIDSDMQFTPESLVTLVDHALAWYNGTPDERESGADPERAEIFRHNAILRSTLFAWGALYPTRGPSPQLCVSFRGEGGRPAYWTPGAAEFKRTLEENAAIEVTGGLGFGFMATPGAALGLLPEEAFGRVYDRTEKRFWGEDFSFCQRLIRAGGAVFADLRIPGVSHNVPRLQNLVSVYLDLERLEGGPEVPVDVRLRRIPVTTPHQKGGVVVPAVPGAEIRSEDIPIEVDDGDYEEGRER